jgi:hypothetical protein
MTRVLVMREDGQVFWSESVTASDFQCEHFCRCLAERLGWAVADAEMLSTPPDVTRLRAERGGRAPNAPNGPLQTSQIAA